MRARREVRRFLTQHTRLAQPTIDAAVLAASELLGNAALYAREGGAELTVDANDSRIRIAVADTSLCLPKWRTESNVDAADEAAPLPTVNADDIAAFLDTFDTDVPEPENADPNADPWAEFIRVTAPEFRRPTIEQIATVTKPIWEALVAGERYSHDRLMQIWEDVRPDAVVTDNVTGYAAVELANAPWVRFVSANPLEMRDRQLPPPLSGLPADDASEWQAFREEYHRQHEDLLAEHNHFRGSVGVSPCPPDEFNTESPWLNFYLFPGVADYPRSRPLGATWHRLESTVRTSDAAFDVAEHVPGDGKVVYLSLGSLGCMDLGLMQRLIDAMAATEHRTIVSMGPLKEQMKLGPNMYGDQFLPQPSSLPQ